MWLDGTPPCKIAHFAGEAKVTDVADLRRVGEDRRLTLIACLLHTIRTAARDEVVTMFCKRMATLDDAPAAEPTAVIAERAGYLVLKTLEQAGGLDALAAAH